MRINEVTKQELSELYGEDYKPQTADKFLVVRLSDKQKQHYYMGGLCMGIVLSGIVFSVIFFIVFNK